VYLAQYKILRENGHSPSEAFNETVEEATQFLFWCQAVRTVSTTQSPTKLTNHSVVSPFPGIDYMYNRRARLGPPYSRRSTARSLRSSTRACVAAPRRARYSSSRHSTYREDLARELKEIDEQEIWRVGKMVRSLRPDYSP
jgi:ketol-acid reductoisomerase